MSIHGATAKISSREFQERTGRSARRREHAELHRRILGQDGLVRSEFLVDRPCPTCAGLESELAFVAGGVPYHRCASCDLLYVPRYVGLQGRERIYPPAEERAVFYQSPLQREFDLPKFRHGAQLLAQHAPSGGQGLRVLDVGTSSGLFLEVLREEGITGTGVETGREAFGEHHAQLGLDVRYERFEELQLERGAYSAVTFWDCLEHLFDPGAVFERCRELVGPGGLVLVLVPNAGSLAARVLHERCAMFDGVQHVNMYTPATLEDFARRRGFQLRHLETIIPEINVLANHLDYRDPYEGPSRELERLLGLDALDTHSLLENGLGYKILAVFAAS